ncbi:sulfotransferase family protein [Thalassotalea sp. HSM 43]|uniref:tetratricopeptide repeat-containing sulfotransferase family protein n=1 Tax=Thalassotalea sp. HSM 43 TaxID=2552945 RepID=UPI0010817582|nr:tetratricopeptide repeat-containing sulfotransferase family protein [Thalassotalea sp. HSM 43]QBY04549.1 sulfotransferase family protein [Thalassotalea sp. HSM 43]
MSQFSLKQQRLNQGVEYLKNKQLQQAIAVSRSLNHDYPDCANSWYFTNQVALASGNLNVALTSLDKACALNNNPNWQLQLAKLALQGQQYAKAKKLVQQLSSQTLSANQDNQLALLLSQLDSPKLAIQHYQSAINKDASNHQHYYSLGAVQRHQGDLVDAERSLTKAIELNPRDVDAHCLRVDLRKQTKQGNYIEQLHSLVDQSLSAKDTVQVQFALAKSYEDLQQYEHAFKHLDKGCQLRRKHLNYDINQDTKIIDSIKETFDANWLQQHGSTPVDNNSLAPVFIIGMPRVGSTMVDQLLAMSQQIQPLGELNHFSSVLSQLTRQLKKPINSAQQFVRCASEVDFAQLGQRYSQSVQQQFSEKLVDKRMFSDKLPLNYLYVGLIKAAIPNAKFIHVQRDPMDTCYAVYKTLFQQVYPFSYEQTELAQYYVAYRQLMQHWQQLCGDSIYQLQYEDLVADPQQQGKALYQFLQLQWHDNYANIENSSTHVTTASASQVRQSIHNKSVNKWRHYQQQLQPMQNILQQADLLDSE